MSQLELKQSLTRLIDELEKDGLDYRKFVLDLEVQSLTINKQYLLNQGFSKKDVEDVEALILRQATNTPDRVKVASLLNRDLVAYYGPKGKVNKVEKDGTIKLVRSNDNFSKAKEVIRFLNSRASERGLITSEFDKNGKVIEKPLRFDTGHVHTANIIEKISSHIYNFDDTAAKEYATSVFKAIKKEYIENVEKLLSQEMHASVDLTLLRNVYGTITGKNPEALFIVALTPQTQKLNNLISILERRIKDTLIRIINEDISKMKGSKSLIEMMEEQLDAAFYGKKSTTKKAKTTVSGSVKPKVKVKLKAKTNSLTKEISSTAKPRIKPKSAYFDTIKLKNLINFDLHDQIKKNMGKGRARATLNYRTGRFARSAKLLRIITDRRGYLELFYTYQRYPYDTFLPGGALYKPRRDPRYIIGKSVRELARKHISASIKVKAKLQGYTR